jgi:hypothetical protein
MKDEIFLWLQSKEKNYKKGIALLEPVIKNKYLLKQLTRKESRLTRNKLIHELKKFAGRAPIPEKSIQAPAAPSPKKETRQVPSTKEINQDEEAQAVEKLEIALGKMHNKKGILSNKLRSFDAGDNKSRKAVLKQIDGLTADMNSIRNKLDFYNKNGHLPPLEETSKDKEIPDDPLQMKQMLLNLRTSRTKINNQLNTPAAKSHAENSKLKNRLQEKIKLIEEIERRLNASK